MMKLLELDGKVFIKEETEEGNCTGCCWGEGSRCYSPIEGGPRQRGCVTGLGGLRIDYIFKEIDPIYADILKIEELEADDEGM
jgi:hypothetical protein